MKAAIIALLSLTACGSAFTSAATHDDTEAGDPSTAQDSGMDPNDSPTHTQEAGLPPTTDSGTVKGVDSGDPSTDSSIITVDSGSPMVDSGSPIVDSGTPIDATACVQACVQTTAWHQCFSNCFYSDAGNTVGGCTLMCDCTCQTECGTTCH